MLSSLEKNFEKIGAQLKMVTFSGRDWRGNLIPQISPVRLDVISHRGMELFEIGIREDSVSNVALSVLEVKPQERHLVLLARELDVRGNAITKDHFLCGHDERHLFVAGVEGVSTVAAAKASLKPGVIREREIGLNVDKANRRKTAVFRRQGEWFFIPVEITPSASMIRKNEPLVRGRGSKPHTAQFAYRTGGVPVRVCAQYPNGLTHEEFAALIRREPGAKHFNWRDMQREPAVYVKGYIRHADHATVVLETWHRVLMNTERQTQAVAFLD